MSVMEYPASNALVVDEEFTDLKRQLHLVATIVLMEYARPLTFISYAVHVK